MYVLSLTLDQYTRSLICQELPRGYVYFTVKTLKQTLNVAQALQAGWLVTKGRLTLIGFNCRGGGNTATLLHHSRRHVAPFDRLRT